ncbi:hypothetical protein ACMGDK_07320 [Chryseobacterium sp. DT-3]|uniref:hypothetical protein n=1 Tax=Chryseobacterium sp. DT-3 TaxID=3396164 RepID=UPI003F1CAF52
MEIKYTSINDVYGNYVFSFQDNINGIQKINDFAEEDIQDSKKVTDSINSHIAGLTKEEAQKYIAGQSLPTSAGNITFYNAPGDFDGEPKADDILIEYDLDEDNFKIKNLNIPNTKATDLNSLTVINQTQESCIIKIPGSDITLQGLNSILKKINETGFHRNSEQYVYIIKGEKDQLMSFLYEQKGKYFSLSFNKR